MPPDAEYSLALSEEERSLLMLCLGMAGGNAMYHKDWEMARTILDFTRKMQEQLGSTTSAFMPTNEGAKQEV